MNKLYTWWFTLLAAVLLFTLTDFMPRAAQSLDHETVVDLIAQGELDNAPRSYVTKGGDILEALVSARPERDKTGKVTLMYVAIKDVTERNRAERRRVFPPWPMH